jgi:hypothetical protein
MMLFYLVGLFHNQEATVFSRHSYLLTCVLWVGIAGSAWAAGDGVNSTPGTDLPIGAGGNTILYLTATTQRLGVGTAAPASKVDVVGDMRAIDATASCSSVNEGALRYNTQTRTLQYCNGSSWSGITPTLKWCSYTDHCVTNVSNIVLCIGSTSAAGYPAGNPNIVWASNHWIQEQVDTAPRLCNGGIIAFSE